MTELPISPATAEDWPAITELLASVFHNPPDREGAWGDVFEPDRSLLVRDEDAPGVVGHAAAFTRDLTVPGAVVPAAHVTMVGVAATHRRRGLLTRLMHRQLAQVPEPLAVLWASEGPIYGRFGYGLASHSMDLRIDTREVRLPEPAGPGRLRALPVEAARPALQAVYEAVRGERPGWSSRNEAWWTRRLLDPEDKRDGATARQITVHQGAAGPDGYALWRVKQSWTNTGPAGEVRVEEVVTANPQAYLALWRFLLSIDLTRCASAGRAALDEPLLYLADAPDQLGTAFGDGLWIRIVDLPAALSARRYATWLDLVIEVTDPLFGSNAGRWRLTAEGDKVTCVRTGEPADLACDIRDLAAAYLGGVRLTALASAGRVRELRADALTTASTGFGWHRAPSALEIF